MPAIWIPKRLVEVSLINAAAKAPENFVNHCEIEYEYRVVAAAAEVLKGGYKVVMVTGPSSSGKTTTAHKLANALCEMGHMSKVVSLDDFYLDLDRYPRLPDGSKDYENVNALDVPEIQKCLAQVINTGKTMLPQFDFKNECRQDQRKSLDVGDGVVVVEGIHALNPTLTDHLDGNKIYKIYAGMREEYSHMGQRILPTRDIRLVRRMVRDSKFRGHSPEKTMSMWPDVCKGEDLYIKVFKPEA
ncbi:MAG: nucleoside kinase, partial [Oscillospiraceae bacterium]